MKKPSHFHGQFVKEEVINLIRQFFQNKNFHEIDTPTLIPSLPLEPGLYSLSTHWHHRQKIFYLATSPESSIKKIISQGIGNCFSIAKAFRDLENIGPTHNLEFSMLEWYEMKKDYHHIAQTTQKLILTIYHGIQTKQKVKKTNILKYGNLKIDLTPPWPQTTLNNLFKKYASVDLSKNLTFSAIRKTAIKKGYSVKGINTWEPLYTQILINEIEPRLPQNRPLIVFDYPTRLSPLCKPCQKSPGFSQRFEFFIAGMEIGNAYTELTDPAIMQKNFIKEAQFRKRHHLPTHPYDKLLIKATKTFPDCTGIAIGVDRLAMLFANTKNIADVLYFPTQKLLD